MKRIALLFCLLASFGSASYLEAQEEEVFRVAEEMPEYPGCEDKDRGSARLRCSRTKLAAYIDANLVYPAEAKRQGVEGAAVVSFIVNKDGSLSDIEVLRDIGAGCGEAAKSVISKMVADGIRWNPGKQRGIPVRVLFNLPVVFKLPKDAVVEEMIAEDIVEEEIIMVDQAIEEDMAVEVPPPPPPPTVQRAQAAVSEAPPPPRPSEEEVFKVVEQMPRFYSASCEELSDNYTRQKCAKDQLMAMINANLNYPEIARENGVEGTCIVQFVIEEDGRMTNIQLLRDPGAGCGIEAVRLIGLSTKNGNRWVPGTQRGRAVAVQQYMPIKFELDGPTPAPEPQEEVFIPEDALRVVTEEIEIDPPQIEEESVMLRPVPEATPPPPPPPPAQVTEEVFKVVEEMPRFMDESCEAMASSSDRSSCAHDKLLDYVYSKLQYPTIAKENDVEGTVVVAFVVEKDGSIADIRVLRDIGAGCGDEATRIVQSMNDNGINWIPGKRRGRAVSVEYNLPVKFRIN